MNYLCLHDSDNIQLSEIHMGSCSFISSVFAYAFAVPAAKVIKMHQLAAMGIDVGIRILDLAWDLDRR